MKKANRFIVLLILIVSGLSSQALEEFQSLDSLAHFDVFTEDTPLDVELKADFVSLLNDISDKRVYHDARFSLKNHNCAFVDMAVKLKTRGNFRLRKQTCDFPPLRFKFKGDQIKGTIFQGQDKLKYVSHCQNYKEEYQLHTLEEFLLYRMYNIFTDYSYRVRLARVNFIDTKRQDTLQRYGFFIEDKSHLANRIGREALEFRNIKQYQVLRNNILVLSLFQYMIGNTDWSVLSGPSGKDCCHNSRPLSPSRADTGWFVVPYDFDQAGLINTRYAVVAAPLPIKTVRQRLFRGRCVHLDQIEPAVAMFNERRQQLEMALILEGSAKDKSYIDGFYKIVNDPKQRARQVDGACLSS